MKSGFLEKIIQRLDRIDPDNLQAQFLRLAAEKGFLETLFHTIHEGIIALDGQGRIQYANHAAHQLLGLPAKIEGQPLQRHLRDVDWDHLLMLEEKEWARLVNREVEVTYPRRRFLNLYVVPLSAMRAGEKGAVVILRDVTREREQEAHTIESEKLNALTVLAAGVAHEIGNPLNSLNIHLQLIDRACARLSEKAAAELRDMVRVSRDEVARLDRIIHQFLRAIRPQPPCFESAALETVLNDTLAFLRQEIKDRDVLVEVETSGELPRVRIDPAQIRQAFFNIIRNAIQAMANGGLLKIRLTATDRFVEAAFRDTGPGIPVHDLGEIFEAFHTTKAEGTGLGLMIVQRIVREHGGEIEVRTEPGAGTMFIVRLPLEAARVRLLKAPKTKSRGRREEP